MNLTDDILAAVGTDTEVRSFDLETERQNQLLFFFKPECFNVSMDQSRLIVEEVLERFRHYRVDITGCQAVTGHRLDVERSVDRHYGFINKMSRSASTEVDEETADRIRRELGASPNAVLLGGHEVMMEHPSLTPEELEAVWASGGRPLKVRSGMYASRSAISESEIVIINGFHPAQLRHFTNPGHSIVLLILNSDLPWRILRNNMLGATNPSEAMKGSIRRTIFDESINFGFESVGPGNNCCHLSAGPFEALFELQNFLANAKSDPSWVLRTARLPQILDLMSVKVSVGELLQNPTIDSIGEPSSLFDATEEIDSMGAAALASLL